MKLEPGDFVEIAGVISILKRGPVTAAGHKIVRTVIGNARGFITQQRPNGFWRVRMESGQLALIHHTAVDRIVGKLEITVTYQDPGAKTIPLEIVPIPEEAWRDMQERGDKPINFV